MAATVVELRKIASELKIAGRSKMGKTDLMRAIAEMIDAAHVEALEMNANFDKITRELARANASSPMSHNRRSNVYRRQNSGGSFTHRQIRRMNKKLNKHSHVYV